MPSLILNDQPVEFELDPATPLLWALRDVANLTGAKYGCGTGECGACMVLVDGEALPSCTLNLAEAAGRSVTTVEALARSAPGGPSNRIVRALIEEQAIQCGFCTPGLVVALSALLSHNAGPTDADVRAAVTNICRCGVYPRILRAVRRVTGPVAASPPAAPANPGDALPENSAAPNGAGAGGE